MTQISANAFSGSKKLKSVVIGKNVTTIGKKAFYNCKKLKTVKIRSLKLKKVGSKAFKGIKKNAKITVPSKNKTKYTKLLQKQIDSTTKIN